MPDWIIPVIIAVIGSGGVGTMLGVILSSRTAAKLAKSTTENTLIDQLQEELTAHRLEAGRRATAQDERLNRLETHNDGYRAHIHDLRSHIWDRKEPPPPEWPADLPR